jgi:hypothetical protein
MLSDPEFFECELLTVSREQAELAASEISGCEACSESAEIHLDWILADVVHRHGMFEFVLAQPVQCPLCHAAVSEKTLVDRGGIEVKAFA